MPSPLRAIRWGDREAALLAAMQARAAAEGVPAPTLAEAVRVALAVAVEAPAAAWVRASKRPR